MNEQATASAEITAAAGELDQQTKEASRSLKEQAMSLQQITAGSANVTKQVKLIAAANLENSRSTDFISERIQEVRDGSRENGESAQSIESILAETGGARASLKRRNRGRRPASSAAETGGRA
jgi:methyl-accepting chemotaxis protein